MEVLVAAMLLLASSILGLGTLGVCALKGLQLFLQHEASQATLFREHELRKEEIRSQGYVGAVDEATKKALGDLQLKISKMEAARLTRGG